MRTPTPSATTPTPAETTESRPGPAVYGALSPALLARAYRGYARLRGGGGGAVGGRCRVAVPRTAGPALRGAGRWTHQVELVDSPRVCRGGSGASMGGHTVMMMAMQVARRVATAQDDDERGEEEDASLKVGHGRGSFR